MVVNSEINPYYWGNLVPSLVPLVALVTKNAYRHSTQSVNVRLEERGPAQK